MNVPILLAETTAAAETAKGINWHSFFFLLFALISCGMALAVLFSSNIVRMAFYLTISLGAVAGLFILAGAHFVGAMQLMIYVGGTLVLLIFGVMLTAQAQFVDMKTRGGEWILAAAVGGSLLLVLLAPVLIVNAWRRPSDEHLAAIENIDVSPDATSLGAALMGLRPDSLSQQDERLRAGMSGYFLHFEIVSVHLLVVLLGAAYLARARLSVDGRAARRRAPPAARRRGVFLTVVLLLAVAIHAFCGAACLTPGLEIKQSLPGLANAQAWLWPALGVCCLLDAALLIVILNWQRWGFYALCVLALLETAMIARAGADSLAVGGTLGAAVVWLAILLGLLKLGGPRSMWRQME